MLSKLNQSGQTLLELMVVMSISIIIIGALVFAVVSSLRNAQFAKNQAQATKLAQEAIEFVRTGRDRNSNISGFTLGGNNITSWRGDDTNCPGNNSSIWCYQINDTCGSTSGAPPSFCYFNVTTAGVLNHLSAFTPTTASPIVSGAESIPPFNRVVTVSDIPTTYLSEKIITAIVTWKDFSGYHESKLSTLLRKI